MPRHRTTRKSIIMMRELKAAGKSIDDIAKELGFHRSTVQWYTNKKNINIWEPGDLRLRWLDRMPQMKAAIREASK